MMFRPLIYIYSLILHIVNNVINYNEFALFFIAVDGPGSPSLLDKAECVQDRNSPIPSNNSNGANITSSEKCDNISQNKIGNTR